MNDTTWTKPEIEHGKLTKWNWMVNYPESFVMGERVDIGAFCFIMAKFGVVIESDVQLGSGVKIFSQSTIDGKQGPVMIHARAKIGANSIIMPGVTIGADATVGACSFVNKDVPAGVVAWGQPVRVKRGTE